MPLIRCADCGKDISDRADACPHCGCPVSVSIAEAEKLREENERAQAEARRAEEEKNRPGELAPVQFDAMVLKLRLYDLISPLAADGGRTKEVKKAVHDDLEQYKTAISETGVAMLQNRLDKIFDRIIEQIKFEASQSRFNAEIALRVYDRIMNKPYEGPGFSIITNSAASMAAYAAVAVRDAKAFYKKQSREADEYMNRFIEQNATEGGVYITMMRELQNGIDSAVFALKCMADARNALSARARVYFEPERYGENAVMRENGGLFAALRSAYAGSDFVRIVKAEFKRGGDGKHHFFKDEKLAGLLAAAEASGFVFLHDEPGGAESWYFSTGKLEDEILREEYLEEHPEERRVLADKKDQANRALLTEAEEAEKAGRYYRAATLYAKCGDDQSLKKSVALWREHILKRRFLTFSPGITGDESGYFIYALTENGSVLSYPRSRYYQRREQTNAVYARMKDIDDAAELARGTSEPFAYLTCDGTVRIFRTDPVRKGAAPISSLFPSDAEPWRKVKTLFCDKGNVAALFEDGTVRELSDSGAETTLSGIVEDWRDVAAMDFKNGTLAALRKDGRVYAASERNTRLASVCAEWEDVKSVTVLLAEVCAVKRDGTVLSTDPERRDELKALRGSETVDCHGLLNVIGMTGLGELKFAGGAAEELAKTRSRRGIVAVGCGSVSDHCLLNADGTLTCSDPGDPLNGVENVAAIYSYFPYLLCVLADGRVLCESEEGDPDHVADIIRSWKLFDDIDDFDKNVAAAPRRRREQKLRAEISDFTMLDHFVEKRRRLSHAQPSA